MLQLSEEYVLERLPRRAPESNKGRYGRVLCLAGCDRFRGAAQLCVQGALRGGAGIMTLASTEKVVAAAAASLPEAVFLPCRESRDGGIASYELPLLLAAAQEASALVVGCGMGNTHDTAVLARALMEQCRAPMVLDADGLNALAGQFPRREAPLIITPHPGEMARLTGLSVPEVEADRAGVAGHFASEHGCTVVLKGHRTLIAAPDGSLYQNTTGNAGMARGGSGDLLAGLMAALLAQGLSPIDAACCGVWLHGTAGDLCAARLSQQAVLPHDMLYDLCLYLAGKGL